MRIATSCTYFVCQISTELRPWSHTYCSMEVESIIHLYGTSCRNMCDNKNKQSGGHHVMLAAILLQCDQGIKNLVADEAGALGGSDPDYAMRDLYNAIANGNYPSWTLKIQVMTFEEAEKFRWNPFDLTKVGR